MDPIPEKCSIKILKQKTYTVPNCVKLMQKMYFFAICNKAKKKGVHGGNL